MQHVVDLVSHRVAERGVDHISQQPKNDSGKPDRGGNADDQRDSVESIDFFGAGKTRIDRFDQQLHQIKRRRQFERALGQRQDDVGERQFATAAPNQRERTPEIENAQASA